MLRISNLVLLLCIAPLGLGACATHERPRETWQPREEISQVSIQPADLGLRPEQLPTAGVQPLDQTPTLGRFPTGLSIVRLDAVTSAESEEHHVRLASVAVDRSAYWNELMNDLPALREVTMQRRTGLDPRHLQYKALLKKSVRDNCGLCLMYARVEAIESEGEFIGVLYDAAKEKALASYRVPVTITDYQREKIAEDDHPERKHMIWLAEAESLAEAELRQLVRDAIWDAADRDGFEPTTQPNPWQSDRPMYPRDTRWRLFEVPTMRKGR